MQPTRLFDFIDYQRQHRPLDKAINTKYKGQWEATSSEEFYQKAQHISRALLDMGIKPGAKIGMISSNNRTEWAVVDAGILQLGAINVPLYPTIAAEDYKYILNHSECQYCFVSDQEVYNKLKSIQKDVETLKEVYCFDTLKGCKHWSELLTAGAALDNQAAVEEAKKAVKPEDLATIIYTSGTTGVPKGVMLSHNNVTTNVIASSNRLPLEVGKATALSFLPLCHIFERVILYFYIYHSITIYFAESLETISDNLKEVQPDMMTAVPRLLEKVYDKIYARGNDLSGIKQKLFYWAVNLGLQYQPYGRNGFWYEFKLKIARKLIFSKWKEALGGNLSLIASGSAPLQPRLAQVFTAAGMTIVEGYGLTETSPVISVNDMRNGGFKIGTVGKIIDGITVKIADDGEILCKGPNVMQGYYKDPEKTAQIMTGDFFHTGDIGEFDADGFLKITDRKKEMFKTSGGKYIAPALIEGVMKQSLFIEQIMVVGEAQKMPAALIQLNFEYVKEWLKSKGQKTHLTDAQCAENQQIINQIQKEIDRYNEQFGKWEKIKKFELTPDVWSIDAGHLTPTMKQKRKVIKEKYKDLIEKIYA
ncbi:MAG: long-chain fatty acid--CoA ligase [Bacteroidetes bacterium]|nr:long-chain fatty acid--CoA ligase [Bacteroidota bacterium]MDA1344698.1 long-chain fatty acid--CoA ligase [Bacteroidota bacterium]